MCSLYFNVCPSSFTNRNRNGSQRYGLLFCRGLALAMDFSPVSSFLVSIDSVTYLSTPRTILTQEAVLFETEIGPEFQQCVVLVMANDHVQHWADSRVLENPSCRTSLLLVSRHGVLSALMLHLLPYFCIKSIEVLSSFDKFH